MFNSLVSLNNALPQWRKKVAFYLEDVETVWGLTINLIILGFIFLSVGIFVAETYSFSDRYREYFRMANSVIIIVFTVEYLLRLWSAEERIKFFFSTFSLIDLLAILPSLLGLIDIRFLRIFRWFRILRVIRFWKLETKVLGVNDGEGVVFLRIFLTLFSIIFIYAGLIYQIEHQINEERLKNFFDALYFVVVTMTTVGYGDVTPLSEIGRAMTLLMILTGVLFIPWQLSELIALVVKNTNSVTKKCQQCNLSRHDPDARFCKQCGHKLV